MTLNAIACLSVAAVSTTLSLLATGEAFAYTFTKIAVSNSIANPFYDAFAAPSLNEQGTAVFPVWLNTERTQEAIFAGNGGPLTIVADTKSPLFNTDYDNSPAINKFAGTSIINNQGTVVFWAGLYPNPNAGAPINTGIFTSNGGSFTTIAKVDDRFKGISAQSAINDGGTVVFTAAPDAGGIGIFTNNSGVITTIATASSFSMFASPMINNKGIVAFSQLDFLTEESGVFISDGKTTTTIADSSGSYSSVIGSAINDKGTVAFLGTLKAIGDGIFSSSGGVITTLVDTSGSFSNFSTPAINNQGLVAFKGTLDTGVSGIFTGSDPVANKVIAIGDTLFGSKITELSFSRKGLNNMGQITFRAIFEDGTVGIFRADPETKSVPEPASVLGLLAVSALGVSSIRRQQKLR